MKKPKRLFELIPTKFPSVFNIQLNLEFETRYVGKLDTAGGGIFLTKRKQIQIFLKYGGNTGSLGINHPFLIDESIPYRWIVIEFDGNKLVTSRFYFLTHGECFNFSNQGFELQCFLPLYEFGLTKAREFETWQVVQENLFPIEAAQ